MPDRTTPNGAFNFHVSTGGPVGKDKPLGGFSGVSGLNTEFTVAKHRNGNDKPNHIRRIHGIHKAGDVTLMRGLVNAKDLWEWISATRTTGCAAKRRAVITLCDGTGASVQKWVLDGVMPMQYTGPTLAAKGDEVAMEELVLSCESVEIEPP